MKLADKVFSHSKVYEFFQSGLSRSNTVRWLCEKVIRADSGMSVLDVGCGPADIFSHLDVARYVGIDHNPKYTKRAQKMYGERGTFHCWDVADLRFKQLGSFNVVLLLGVLHHLTDAQITVMLDHISNVLKHNGRLVTIDPAIENGQHPVARLLAKLDRGRCVRSASEYKRLIEQHFQPCEAIVRHDLLRVPYTNAIFTAVPKSLDSRLQTE